MKKQKNKSFLGEMQKLTAKKKIFFSCCVLLFLFFLFVILIQTGLLSISKTNQDDLTEAAVENNQNSEREFEIISEDTEMNSSEEAEEENILLYKSYIESENYIIPSGLSVDEYEKRMKNFLVQIQSGDLSGTGAWWMMDEERVYIVTCAHVIQQEEETILITGEGDEYPVVVEYLSTEKDLAFLSISIKAFMERDRDVYSMAQLYYGMGEEELDAAASTLKKTPSGDTILIAGFTADRILATSQGYVINPEAVLEGLEGYYINCYAQAEEGMSGGILIDETGSAQGMIVAGTENYTACLSFYDILIEYRTFIQLNMGIENNMTQG